MSRSIPGGLSVASVRLVRPLLVALGPVTVAGAAHAAGPRASGPVDVEWTAPSECPDRAFVEGEIARLATVSGVEERWKAQATVTHAAGGTFRVRLVTDGAGGRNEREFSAPSCRELAATVAVVLAVAVVPRGSSPASSAPPTVLPPPLPLAPPPPLPWPERVVSKSQTPTSVSILPPPASSATPQSPRKLRKPFVPPPLVLAVDARGSLGALATPAFGFDVGLAWAPRHARLEVDGFWYPNANVPGPVAGTGGAFDLRAGSLAGCWLPWDGRLKFGGCVGGEAGSVHVHATGASITSTQATSPWVAADAFARGVWTFVPHLAVRASLGIAVPFVRDDFVITNQTSPVHQPTPIVGEGALGVEVQIP